MATANKAPFPGKESSEIASGDNLTRARLFRSLKAKNCAKLSLDLGNDEDKKLTSASLSSPSLETLITWEGGGGSSRDTFMAHRKWYPWFSGLWMDWFELNA